MTDQDPTQRFQPPGAHARPPAPPPVADQATTPVPPAAVAGAPVPPPPAGVAFAPPNAALPASEAVATAPVAGSTSRRGRGRLRWLAVGIIALLVAGAAAGATLLLTADSGDPDVLAYTPANSLTYAELRLDLPGSQQAELAQLMSAFPGFDDQAAFPAKLNEVLDQLVGKATDGKQSWTNDIDPWFGRQLSVSVGPLPDQVAGASKDGHALLLASVKDAAKAQAWIDGIAVEHGATTSAETYNGVTLTSVTPADGRLDDVPAAYAVVGPVLAVGDIGSVKAAIDTGGTSGLNTVAQFQTAEASISGDRLGFAYVDAKGLADGARALAGDAGAEVPSLPAIIDELTVPWAVAAIRAEGGSFVVDTRNPHVDAMGPATSSDTTVASVLPPTTVALAEGHDVGQALTRFKDLATGQEELREGVTQLEDALQLVGGWDAVVGWMGDAGVAVTRDGDAVSGGVVIAPTSREDPERLLTQLRGFIQLAGGGSGITVTDEDYNGTTISVIHVANLGALAGGATNGVVEAPTDLTISYAVTDQVVVLGYGTDFTRAVLDAQGGESLATTPRFSEALTQAGTTHASLFWLDIAGLRGLAETMIPAEERDSYEADAKPYLDAFDSVIGTFTPATDLDRGTVIIRVTGD